MALHEQSVGATDEWYTPPEIFEALDCHFYMDVASPGASVTPWIPAAVFITTEGLGGLCYPWRGFVWMNPPFGARNGLVPWLTKFAGHRNGIALVPDRTSAPWFQDFAPQMDALLFTRGKIKFIGADGQRGESPAQGTCLMAMGALGISALRRASRAGLGLLTTPSQHPDLGEG